MMGMAEDRAIRANELERKSYDEVKEYCVNRILNEYEAKSKMLSVNSCLLKRQLCYVILTVTGSTILI